MNESAIEADAPTGDEVMADAYGQFAKAGLRRPPVPRDLVPAMQAIGPWRYGTSDVDPGDRHELVTEADDPAAGDSIVFGHVGHGGRSWSICCRLLLAPLAVFVRHPWGGADGDAAADSVAVHRSFHHLEELIVRAESAAAAGRIPRGKRLIVVVDDVQGNGWRTPDGTWKSTRTPFEDAIAFVTPDSSP